MPANECIPLFEPGRRVTGKSTGTITGKRAVVISGNRVTGLGEDGGLFSIVRAGAAVGIFGIAAYDGVADSIIPVIKGGIVPVTSGAAVAANAEVQTDATGRFVTLAGGVAVGRCLSGVGAADLDMIIDLYNGGASSVPATAVVGDQAAIADLDAMTQAAITGGESPTEAEFNALQGDVAENRTKINAILAALRTAGLLTP